MNIVSNLWNRKYRDCAVTLTLALATLTGCGLLVGCEMFQPQYSQTESTVSGETTPETTAETQPILKPSKAETAVNNATEYTKNVIVPIGNAADPATGGLSGVITLGVFSALSLIGNVLQNIRLVQERKLAQSNQRVITTIQRDTDTGIIPMMKSADPETLAHARKLVGEA